MKLVLGIGNIGKEYEETRHNSGFMALDELAQKYNTSITKKEFNAYTSNIEINNEKIILVKPTTMVNLSGQALMSIMLFYKIKKEDIIIVYDDMDILPGHIKLAKKGTSAGHNGIKSIIEYLNSDVFFRIKIGIGRDKYNKISYVLGKPEDKIEYNLWKDGIILASQAVEMIINKSFDQAMNKYNTKDHGKTK